MAYRIDIVKGDITTMAVDSIVNAANNQFWMGAGVAGAIKSKGGEVIEQEAMKKGPVMPGEAVFTGAGRLPYRCIIHAAVMGQDLHTSDKYIRQSTIASLRLADSLSLKSIAFPAFGTGVGGFPVRACAHVMITAIRSWESHSTSLERVVLCLYDDTTYAIFRDYLETKKG
ncbi:MAG: macro domain-containing protein [Candidatus Zixiibacteriota bacterium]